MTSAHFACALSRATRGERAIGEALATLEERLDGTTPDLVLAFATHHHGAALEELGPRVARATGARAIAGCTAESVLGDGVELDGRPGLVLWAAATPGLEVRPFHLEARAGAEAGTVELLGLDDLPLEDAGSLLVLADPFTFPADAFLEHVHDVRPGLAVTGGIASGAMGPGQTLFFTADGVAESGLSGLAFAGAGVPRPVVSQGCRPIGEPFVITDCERNEVRRLAGRPALEVLFETVCKLEPCEQRLFQSGPFVGLAVDATRPRFERGDLLVRGVLGVNHAARSFTVSEFVRRGQTIQLQVRDPERAGEDLTALVRRQAGCSAAVQEPAAPLPRDPTSGALIFTCSGRGTRMFDAPDHDVTHVLRGLGREVPTAGFFASGEIGPVGDHNYLHGFTASVALFAGARP